MISSFGQWFVSLTIESQSRESLVNTVDDSIMLVEPEPEPKIIYKNEAASRMMDEIGLVRFDKEGNRPFFKKQ